MAALRDGKIGRLILLWWAGVNLRITLLAVPPVIPSIHRDLDVSQTMIGIVTGLPVLLLALAAVFGAFLISRLGARRALLVGLVVVGVASALRGVGPSVSQLLSMTFVMGIGVAVMQPALPAIVRDWFPASVGLSTAVYANGLLVGEILSAGLTIPYILPLLGDSWPWSLAFWSVPAILTALAVWLFVPADPPPSEKRVPTWRLDWRGRIGWSVGLILAGAASLYFTANAFIPDLLTATGESARIGGALTSLNAGQIPASILLLLFSRHLIGPRWPVLGAAVVGALGVGGLMASSGAWLIAWAGLIGFAAAFILIWTLAMPAMLADPADVHRVSAMVFTVGYFYAFVSPFLGGLLWDLTGRPGAGFVPAAVGMAAILAGAWLLPSRRATG